MKQLKLARTMSLMLLLAACSGNGLTDADKENKTGVEAAQQVEEQVGVYPAEFLTAYIDAIGRRLVAGLDSTPYYFRFRIIDQGEPNAFAVPGGYIYVSRGLLALINNEDELAAILAHLIIHITQQHQGQQVNRGSLNDMPALPGRAIRNVVKKDIDKTLNAPLEAVGRAYFSTYNLEQEKQADRLGMRLAALAGYDPLALATVLHNLERTIPLLTNEQHEPGFFDNHPTTPEQITDITREATNIAWTSARPFAPSKQDLLDRLNGLPWGADNPMQGILRGRQFMQPDMDLSITFPDGWRTVNTTIFVGAFAPENQGLIILGGADKPGPVADIAAAFIEELHFAAELEPAEAHAVKLDAGPAYLVRIEDASSVQPVSIYYLWVNTRNTTFRFIAAGAESFRDQLSDSVLSLRNMTEDEKTSIVDDRIESVEANAGESIHALSARTGNRFSPELTAAVNGLSDTVLLEQGQLVKILRRKPYLH